MTNSVKRTDRYGILVEIFKVRIRLYRSARSALIYTFLCHFSVHS